MIILTYFEGFVNKIDFLITVSKMYIFVSKSYRFLCFSNHKRILLYLIRKGLNDRQVRVVLFVKEKGEITNSDYQKLNAVSRETATRDIKELIDKNQFKPSGQKGAGAFYTLN